MRFAIVLTMLLACGSVPAQNPAEPFPDVPKLEGLNLAQQKSLEDYVHQHEKPTGEFRVIADRRMKVFSSEALRSLFPKFRFVAIRWIYEADPAAMHKYSVPGPIVQSLVLDEDGRNRIPKKLDNGAEFGDLLREEHIRVTDATSAALVKSALRSMEAAWDRDDPGTSDLRHEGSDWLLGYHEWPFRAISSSEEIREAHYYLISVDADGFVISGRAVTKVLERRKLASDAPH